MLETMQERVKLLKAGISGKRIEELYVTGNDIKIVNLKLLYIEEGFSMLSTGEDGRIWNQRNT